LNWCGRGGGAAFLERECDKPGEECCLWPETNGSHIGLPCRGTAGLDPPASSLCGEAGAQCSGIDEHTGRVYTGSGCCVEGARCRLSQRGEGESERSEGSVRGVEGELRESVCSECSGVRRGWCGPGANCVAVAPRRSECVERAGVYQVSCTARLEDPSACARSSGTNTKHEGVLRPTAQPQESVCRTLWLQCGGIDWKGPTCCEDSDCVATGPYYSHW
jgi:hypothetical protein